jgi:hypothetical protein
MQLLIGINRIKYYMKETLKSRSCEWGFYYICLALNADMSVFTLEWILHKIIHFFIPKLKLQATILLPGTKHEEC